MMGGWAWWWVRVWAVSLLVAPAWSFYMAAGEGTGPQDVVDAINRMTQALENHERHTTLYERVALLETMLSSRAQTEAELQAEVQQLREKIPALEQEIETIPDMRKELAEFEAKIGKLVQDYEAKLSALASEVIRLKKNGQRRKDLETLSDGSNILLRTAPACPEVGQGMVGERVGDQCLYLSLTSQLNWTAAHHHCQELGGDLAAPQDLMPLKAFLHQAFTRGPSLWLGASYQFDEQANNEGERGDSPRAQTAPADPRRANPLTTGESSNPPPVIPPPQPDDATSVPEIRNDMPPSLAMLSDEGADVSQLTGAVNFRLTHDQTAMFGEDPMMVYGNMEFSPVLVRHRQNSADKEVGLQQISAEDRARESENDPSVVDVILLRDNAEEYSQNLPEHQNIEERSLPCNATAYPGCVSAEGNDGNTAASYGSGGQETPPSDVDEARRQQEGKKATMHCMLLQQRESLDYELVGKPCDEIHNFVCDFNFTFDNMLRE